MDSIPLSKPQHVVEKGKGWDHKKMKATLHTSKKKELAWTSMDISKPVAISTLAHLEVAKRRWSFHEGQQGRVF